MSGWATKEPVRNYSTGSSLTKSSSTNQWSSSSPKSPYSTSTTSNDSTQVQDTRDINEVTKRMLKLAVESDDMANESLKGLEEQNEIIKKQQDEVASMADELNVADRKIKGIRSFFSHLGNQFKKDNSGEHQKARQKYEKENAKTNFKNEGDKMKNEEKKHEDEFKDLQEQQKQILEQDQVKMREAKEQSRQDYKAAKKGGEATGDTVFMGKFSFQANALPGEQCEAENDIDQIGNHVKGLKSKAEAMKGYVDESNKRIGDLHTDLKDVQDRTQVATKKGDKIIKNDSFF